MAGAFTHILLCETALNDRDDLTTDLRNLLRSNGQFARLGSVSPDLPYLAAGGGEWADAFHYEQTDSVVRAGLKQLAAGGRREKEQKALLAWLMGYASHLVADATIHPVVQATVGPYAVVVNQKPHRLCEMAQDSLLYLEVKNQELTKSEVSTNLRLVDDSEQRDALFDFWRGLVVQCYPGKAGDAKPDAWFWFYKNAIDAVDGGSGVVAIFRHLGLDGKYAYETAAALKRRPDTYRDFYTAVHLPDGSRGSFLTKAFYKAQDNIVAAWNDLYDSLGKTGDAGQIVCNWNLDTGVNQDSAEREVTFWRS